MGRATIVSRRPMAATPSRLITARQSDARVAKFDAKIAEMEDRATATRAGRRISGRPLIACGLSLICWSQSNVALTKAAPRDNVAIDAKRKQIDAKTTEIVKQQQWLAPPRPRWR